MEADLGWSAGGIGVAGTYNWTILQPEWTNRGDWGVYAGPGVAAGFGFSNEVSHFNVGVAGQVGIEYSFWFPLQVSIDIRPILGLNISTAGSGLYFGGYVPAVGVRYKF